MSLHQSIPQKRPAARWLPAVTVLTVATVLAACGAGEKSTSSKVDTSGLDAAKATVSKYSGRPGTIPITTPIGKKIPSGKKIVFISCGVDACNLESSIIKSATDQLGWTLTTINTDGSPEQIKAAWARVVREKPDGVLYTGTERSTFDAELAQAKKNGTVVAACCTADAVGNGIDFMSDTPDQVGAAGDLQAAWVVAQSGGKADSVYIDVPAFKILSQLATSYKEGMKKYCASCTADTLEMPLTAFGKDVPGRIVSYLRAHPQVKYVGLSLDDMAVGLPGALSAAKLTDVKIVGQGATTTTLQYIGSGQQGASVAFPYYEIMWSMVDAVARKVSGVPIQKGDSPPVWLLTKDNLPSTTKLFPVVPDQDAKFKALWGTG